MMKMVNPPILVRSLMACGWLGHQAAYDLWELEQHPPNARVVPLFASTPAAAASPDACS
jgi:hypothetical protein